MLFCISSAGEVAYLVKHIVQCSSGLNCKAYIPLRRKIIALGPLDAKCENFALGIPTCWSLKMLKLRYPHAKPQCEPMEYRWCWIPNAKFSRWPCTFYVNCAHFICVG